ncbi:MAG TPA: hypothetical protein VN081_02290 [Dongiaceae bacterium]|nr:hypothetical protein [Dongiaceae bacterium]
MVDQKRSPNFLDKTKANNSKIVQMIEAKKGPVGPGHHNSHRTAAIMKWLNSKESGKKGDSGGGQSNPYGNTPPDNPNVDSNPNDWTPKKSKNHGVSPKGTPDKNLGEDRVDKFKGAPDRMPMFGLKDNKNKAGGPTPNIHLPAPRALSPSEAKYYEYLRSKLNEPGGVDRLNQFLQTVHDSQA